MTLRQMSEIFFVTGQIYVDQKAPGVLLLFALFFRSAEADRQSPVVPVS